MALVPTDEIQMLGVPLGSDTFVSHFVDGKLCAGTVKVMAKLAEFEDPQAAMYLLRLSYGIVRANHFMRTTPFYNGLIKQISLMHVLGKLLNKFSAQSFLTRLMSKHVCRPRLEVLAFGEWWIMLLEHLPRVGTSLLERLMRSGRFMHLVDLITSVKVWPPLIWIVLSWMDLLLELASVMFNAFDDWMWITQTRGSLPCLLL